MKNKAFTLVELLAVITILALLALIALPVLVGTWVQPINIMVNTRFASAVSGGAKSWMDWW